MAAKFTPRLIELTYEAALKSYWRKEALKKFLRASYISENFLPTLGGEESKRDFLDKVFQKLQASDKGKAVIYIIRNSGTTHVRNPRPQEPLCAHRRSRLHTGSRLILTRLRRAMD